LQYCKRKGITQPTISLQKEDPPLLLQQPLPPEKIARYLRGAEWEKRLVHW